MLRNEGCNTVVFDLDLTAVAVHSHGVMRRALLAEYCSEICPDFKRILPILDREKFNLAIASYVFFCALFASVTVLLLSQVHR